MKPESQGDTTQRQKMTLQDLEYNLGTKACWPHLGPTYSPLSMIFNGFSFQTIPLMPLLPKIQTHTGSSQEGVSSTSLWTWHVV